MSNTTFNSFIQDITAGNILQDEILQVFLENSKKYNYVDIRPLTIRGESWRPIIDGIGAYIGLNDKTEIKFQIIGSNNQFKILAMNSHHYPVVLADGISWIDSCQKILDFSTDTKMYLEILSSSPISQDYEFPANHPIITNVKLLKYLEAISVETITDIDPFYDEMHLFYKLHNGLYIYLFHTFMELNSQQILFDLPASCSNEIDNYTFGVLTDYKSDRFIGSLAELSITAPSHKQKCAVEEINLSPANFRSDEVTKILSRRSTMFKAPNNLGIHTITARRVATINTRGITNYVSEDDLLKIIERVNALEK